MDEYASKVLKAKRVYMATGHPVWPWEVDDFPSDWMEAIDAVYIDTPNKAERIQRTKNPKR